MRVKTLSPRNLPYSWHLCSYIAGLVCGSTNLFCPHAAFLPLQAVSCFPLEKYSWSEGSFHGSRMAIFFHFPSCMPQCGNVFKAQGVNPALILLKPPVYCSPGLQLSRPQCVAMCKLWSQEPPIKGSSQVATSSIPHQCPFQPPVIVQHRDLLSKFPVFDHAPFCYLFHDTLFPLMHNGVPRLSPINGLWRPQDLIQQFTAVQCTSSVRTSDLYNLDRQ